MLRKSFFIAALMFGGMTSANSHTATTHQIDVRSETIQTLALDSESLKIWLEGKTKPKKA